MLGTLRREGWRPKRSLLFASWDAEEFGLTSSTEWAEQHAEWLREPCRGLPERRQRRIGIAIRRRRITVAAAGDCRRRRRGRDPSTGVSVLSAERGRDAQERGIPAAGTDADVIADRLGGGSDYTVFLNHLGVPSADLGFNGDDWAYHTAFDTHEYVDRVTDPGFQVYDHDDQTPRVAATRLASADVVPIDPVAAAAGAQRIWREIEPRVPRNAGRLAGCRSGSRRLRARRAGVRPQARLGARTGDSGQVCGSESPAAAARASLHRRRRVCQDASGIARADGTGPLPISP